MIRGSWSLHCTFVCSSSAYDLSVSSSLLVDVGAYVYIAVRPVTSLTLFSDLFKVTVSFARFTNSALQFLSTPVVFILSCFPPTVVRYIYSQNCLNSHLFHPVTCLYGQLSVTSLRFASQKS